MTEEQALGLVRVGSLCLQTLFRDQRSYCSASSEHRFVLRWLYTCFR